MKKLLVTGCWLRVIGSIPPLKGGRGMSLNFHFQISNFLPHPSNYSILTTNY